MHVVFTINVDFAAFHLPILDMEESFVHCRALFMKVSFNSEERLYVRQDYGYAFVNFLQCDSLLLTKIFFRLLYKL